MRTPLIAIIGRPNVGKSTLFNRMIGQRKAIVEDVAGVTRDRNYHYTERHDFPFTLVDTGGFERSPNDELYVSVVAQTTLAAEEADLIIALFDSHAGLQPGDRDLIDMLRRYDKPIAYVANKVDGNEHLPSIAEFYELGVDHLFDVSALHGRKVRELIESVLKMLPNYAELKAAHKEVRERRAMETAAVEEQMKELGGIEYDDEEETNVALPDRLPTEEDSFSEYDVEDFAPVFVPGDAEIDSHDYEKEFRLRDMPERSDREIEDDEPDHEAAAGPAKGIDVDPIETIRIALVGRPNVGKSTLFNRLLGENRAITSPIAGTTRDSLEMRLEKDTQKFMLVDTAGLRKKGKVDEGVERYSAIRSLSAISECDVAILLIDGLEGPTDQDAKVAGLAHEQGRGLVIVVNKWDLVEKDHRTAHEFKLRVEDLFKFAPYAPHLFISAKSGRRCEGLLGVVKKIAYARRQRVSTNRLNRMLEKGLRRVPPPSYRGGPVRLFFASQVDIAPPRFVLVFNYPKGAHFSYLRFIKNAIREAFGFEGTDIKFKLSSRRKPQSTRREG